MDRKKITKGDRLGEKLIAAVDELISKQGKMTPDECHELADALLLPIEVEAEDDLYMRLEVRRRLVEQKLCVEIFVRKAQRGKKEAEHRKRVSNLFEELVWLGFGDRTKEVIFVTMYAKYCIRIGAGKTVRRYLREVLHHLEHDRLMALEQTPFIRELLAQTNSSG
jgi:polyhydroxyalkanoate synthesis regulator phasin